MEEFLNKEGVRQVLEGTKTYVDEGVRQVLEGTKTYVDAQINTKQDILIPGTNIKNVNGESILSPGDIEIPGIMSTQEVRDTVIDVLYPALPAPTDVEATDETISFDAVSGAEKYEVFANGNWIGEQLVTRSLRVSIDLTTLQGWNDLPDGTYDITVAATAEGYTRIIQSSAVNIYKGNLYLTFSSPSSFTLNTPDYIKRWDGVLEYSTDKENWNVWDGTIVLNSGSNNELYLRGTGNTVISMGAPWQLNGTDISCSGNVENLLDYQAVMNGQHPTMGEACYDYMFSGCTSLIQAPELPATTLSNNCYLGMFYDCSSLTTAPQLPATTLTYGCYEYMFKGCTRLAATPELPATTLTYGCYRRMFDGCTNLITAPALPATTLADYCYASMFYGCTSLATAPVLSTITLASGCYQFMFCGCTSLTQAPALPATILAIGCYSGMFYDCLSLVTAPELPATTLAVGCYESMFYDCTNLTTAPTLPATALAERCYYYMFYGCTSLYASDTQTSEAQYEWRIPANDVITGTTYSQSEMFINCLGTRSSNDLAGEVGQQYIYYTQNPPVGNN